jgi:hypothetical protein
MKRTISIFLTGILTIVAVLAVETSKMQLSTDKKDTFEGEKEYKTIRITYPTGSREGTSGAKTVMEISRNWAKITTVSHRRDTDAPVQATYLDYNTGREIKTALLKGEEFI